MFYSEFGILFTNIFLGQMYKCFL